MTYYQTCLAVYRPPFSDELLYGWLSSLAAGNYIHVHGIQKIVHLLFPYSKKPEHRDTISRDPVRMDFMRGLSENVKYIRAIGHAVPDADALLARNTPLVALGIAKTSGEQARYIHTACASVNGDWYDMPSLPQTVDHLAACPECLKESRHLRTWHHLPGVKVCAVHSVPLRRLNEKAFRERNLYLWDDAEGPGAVTDEAVAYARYVKAIYDIPTDIALADIYRSLMGRPDRLTVDEAKHLGKKTVSFEYLVRILMNKVPDYTKWAKGLTAAKQKNRPSELIREGLGGIGDFQCPDCGHGWTDSIEAVRLGMTCPFCMGFRLPDDFMADILHNIGDGRYSLTGPFRGMGATQEVLHETCGKVQRGRLSARIWQRTTCQCEYRETAASIQARIDAKAKGFTVLSYTHTQGILRVRHDTCGSVRELTYMSFLGVPYCPECRAREIRLEKERKILSNLGKDYEIASDLSTSTTVSIRHIPCGTVITGTRDSFLHDERHCPICVPYRTSKRDGRVSVAGRLYMDMQAWFRHHRVWISSQHRDAWHGKEYREALGVLVKKGLIYRVARGVYSDRADITTLAEENK